MTYKESSWDGEKIETAVDLCYSWVYQPASYKVSLSLVYRKSEQKHVRKRYQNTYINTHIQRDRNRNKPCVGFSGVKEKKIYKTVTYLSNV